MLSPEKICLKQRFLSLQIKKLNRLTVVTGLSGQAVNIRGCFTGVTLPLYLISLYDICNLFGTSVRTVRAPDKGLDFLKSLQGANPLLCQRQPRGTGADCFSDVRIASSTTVGRTWAALSYLPRRTRPGKYKRLHFHPDRQGRNSAFCLSLDPTGRQGRGSYRSWNGGTCQEICAAR